MKFPLILFVVLGVTVTGCGGSGGSNSSGSNGSGSNGTGDQAAAGTGSLVTKVEHASAKVEGKSIVGTVKITEGGKPGEHLALRYGLVDAVSGVRASQEERLAAKYTTTASVDSKDVTIRFPKPNTPTDYLLHFVLYGTDGSYLASSDSDVFSVH